MTKLITVLIAMGLTSAAFAAQTFQASQTSCEEIQSALQADGAVTLETWLGSTTYVASPTDCNANEIASSAFENTNDKVCSVGYVCKAAHKR